MSFDQKRSEFSTLHLHRSSYRDEPVAEMPTSFMNCDMDVVEAYSGSGVHITSYGLGAGTVSDKGAVSSSSVSIFTDDERRRAKEYGRAKGRERGEDCEEKEEHPVVDDRIRKREAAADAGKVGEK